MAPLIFDIETKNTFFDVGGNDPALLDISVVGIYDYATNTLKAFVEHEFKEMWPYFEKADAIVGYNSEHFDIPLLNKYYAGDLTKIKSIDLMKAIQDSLGRRIKLQDVASATLGVSKSGQGLDAITWWKEGKIDKIIEYCLKDVSITRDLFDYMKRHGEVFIPDGGGVSKLSINTKSWNEGDRMRLTHAMPW